MLDAFALHDIIYDETGQPVDYRYVSVNPSFERLTGLRSADLIGKRVLEVLPNLEPKWLETYGRVATTGEPVHFEDYDSNLERHWEVTAYRPSPGKFACIFSDVTERKCAEQRLEQEAEFRRVLGGIANDFITVPQSAIDESIVRALEAIGTSAGADRSYVILFDFDAATFTNSHEWCREGIEPEIGNLQGIPLSVIQWVVDPLTKLEDVHIPDVARMPDELAEARQHFQEQGIRSLMLVPLASEGRCVGTVGFDFVRSARTEAETEIRLLRLAGATLSNALDRRRAEHDLRLNRALLRDVMDLVPAYVCAKDAEGRFILVNKRLSDFYGTTVEAMTGALHADLCEDPEELTSMLAADADVMRSGNREAHP